MRARMVNESLDRFGLLDNNFLAENVLTEKLDINTITNTAKKIAVLVSMFIMFADGKSPEIKNSLDAKQLENNPKIITMAQKDHLSRDAVFFGFQNILDNYIKKEKEIFIIDSTFIDDINDIKPGRLNINKIAKYEQFNDDILKGMTKLKKKGENVNPDLIKAIMIIETSMHPVKNKFGFQGFPQTKQHAIDEINSRYDTNFTMNDMYDAEEASQFIHYYIKNSKRSKYVKSIEDVIIAYNQGIGTLGKIKRGKKDMPSQAIDYIKLFKAMQKHFVS